MSHHSTINQEYLVEAQRRQEQIEKKISPTQEKVADLNGRIAENKKNATKKLSQLIQFQKEIDDNTKTLSQPVSILERLKRLFQTQRTQRQQRDSALLIQIESLEKLMAHVGREKRSLEESIKSMTGEVKKLGDVLNNKNDTLSHQKSVVKSFQNRAEHEKKARYINPQGPRSKMRHLETMRKGSNSAHDGQENKRLWGSSAGPGR